MPSEPLEGNATKCTEMLAQGSSLSIISDHLTATLAARVMHWRVGPDRFMMGERRWIPRWRFQPAENLMDAFQLLESAAPDEYSMSGGNDLGFRVRIRIGSVMGEARGISKPLAITQAIARAVGIEVAPFA